MQWQGRECKIEDGCWMMSMVGEPDNWDYGAGGPTAAVAGSLPGDVTVGGDGMLSESGYRKPVAMLPLNKRQMLFLADDATLWLMDGNPARVDLGKITRAYLFAAVNNVPPLELEHIEISE